MIRCEQWVELKPEAREEGKWEEWAREGRGRGNDPHATQHDLRSPTRSRDTAALGEAGAAMIVARRRWPAAKILFCPELPPVPIQAGARMCGKAEIEDLTPAHGKVEVPSLCNIRHGAPFRPITAVPVSPCQKHAPRRHLASTSPSFGGTAVAHQQASASHVPLT